MARHALVVGLSQYPYIPTKYPPYNASLKQPPIDAEKVAQILEQHGKYTVNRLPQRWNKQTQKYEIDPQESVSDLELASALKILLKELPENGASIEGLVYFAGHGFTFNSNLGVEKGMIATSNTKITMKDEQVIDYQNAVSFSDLNDVIKKSNLQSLVLILDCCHSGYFIEKEMTNNSLRTGFNKRDYYCISACRTREKSHVLDGEDHSIFSRAVIDGLNASQANQQGKITGDRLYDYIQSELTVKGPEFGQTAIKMGWGEGITIVSYQDLKKEVLRFNSGNPYKGLYSFEKDDGDIFCGRKEAIEDLNNLLNRNRFLAVIGSSGCGKSSLIKAGLLPILDRDKLEIKIISLSYCPLERLDEAVNFLKKQIGKKTLLFIDQCEEIFTLHKKETQEKFFERIVQEVESQENQHLSHILVAIRGDFLDQCAEFSRIAQLINRQENTATVYFVEPLSQEELKSAIEEPAKSHGVSLEPDLAYEIISDVKNETSPLPLLQSALHLLWQKCITDQGNTKNDLTKKAYQEIGGVGQALSNEANKSYSEFSEVEKNLVQELFLDLANIEDPKVTKRPFKKDDFILNKNNQELRQKVLEKLVNKRLIVINLRKNFDGNSDDYIEVPHESLFEKWDTLKKWIDDNREYIPLKREFDTWYGRWLDNGKPDSGLLSGLLLSNIEKWFEKSKQLDKLNDDEKKKFFDLSIALREKTKKDKAQQQKRIILGSIAIGIFGILSLLLGFVLWQSSYKNSAKLWLEQAKLYDKNHQQLEAMMASVISLNQLKQFPLNLFVKFGDEKNITEQIKSIVENIKEKNRITLDSPIKSVNWNPAKNLIATGTNKGQLQLWLLGPEGQINYVSKPIDIDKPIMDIEFSHNHQILASATFGQSIDLRKLTTDNKLNSIKFNDNNRQSEVFDVSFNKDDQFLVAGSYDGLISIWKKENQTYQPYTQPIFQRISQENQKQNNKDPISVTSIDFNPIDNSTIVYGNSLGQVFLLNQDTQNNEKIFFDQEKSSVNSVRFSKQGKYLATAGSTGIISIWQCKPSCQPRPRIKTKTKIISLAFNDNEKLLAAGGENGTIYIWDIEQYLENPDNYQSIELLGHNKPISGLVFAGKYLISVSKDQTLRIWITDAEVEVGEDPLKYGCEYLKGLQQSDATQKPNISLPDFCFKYK